MEALVPMTSAACVGLAVLALLPGGRHVPRPSGEGPAAALLRACAAVAAWPPARRLLGLGALRVLADEAGRLLRAHGMSPSEDEAAAVALAVAVAPAPLLAILSWSPVGLVVGLAASVVGVPGVARSVERRRTRDLDREMPDVLRSLAVALGAGRTLSQAIEYVGVHERGRIGSEFARAALSLRCGSSTDEALRELESRLDVAGKGLLSTALSISQRTGSPLRGLLLSSAELAESSADLERSLVTKTAQARLSIRIVCAMPVLMVGALSTLSPEFRNGMATAPGMACLAVATLLDALALLLVRRLMRGVMP